MLRKLIFFAITSGLAKKAYSYYRSKNASGVADALLKPMPTASRHPAAKIAGTGSGPGS